MESTYRTMEWLGNGLRLLDQRALPTRLCYLEATTVDLLIDAIATLAVRGAPALGAAGAYGVVIAMDQGAHEGWDAQRVEREVDRVRDARPTAVNLAWGVDRVRPLMAQGRDAVLNDAHAIAREDEAANRAMGVRGADWLLARLSHIGDRKLRLLTHCNTGTLATTSWGTALGVIRELAARDRIEIVYVDETRPLLQGARLTAWELAQDSIAHLVQSDGAAASTIMRGLVDAALIGADRVAANGDTANKIGSVGVALACADAGIPFLVVAPESTVDLNTAHGDEIHIEMRNGDEVLNFAGLRTAPLESEGFNPAFDVTPARLITAFVCESVVLEVSKGQIPAMRWGREL